MAERRPTPAAAPRIDAAESDHAALLRLDRGCIDAVQNSDVRRFEEILAEDFVCGNPDGSARRA